MFLILEGFNLLRMLLYFALLLNTEKVVVLEFGLERCSKNLPAHYSQIWPLPRHPPTRPALSLSILHNLFHSLPKHTSTLLRTHSPFLSVYPRTVFPPLSPFSPPLTHQKNIPFTSPIKKTHLSQQTLLTSL